MKPRRKNKEIQKDLFRIELKDLIDKTHSLVKLAEMIDWESLTQEFGIYYHDGGITWKTDTSHGGSFSFTTHF